VTQWERPTYNYQFKQPEAEDRSKIDKSQTKLGFPGGSWTKNLTRYESEQQSKRNFEPPNAPREPQVLFRILRPRIIMLITTQVNLMKHLSKREMQPHIEKAVNDAVTGAEEVTESRLNALLLEKQMLLSNLQRSKVEAAKQWQQVLLEISTFLL